MKPTAPTYQNHLARPAFRSIRYAATQCRCNRDAPELNASYTGEGDPTVEEILRISRQGIGFWPRLKNCPSCLEARLDDLMVVLDRTVTHLGAAVDELQQGSGPSLAEVSRALIAAGHGASTQSASYSLGATSHVMGRVPPMTLGHFRLDQQQSLALLRSVYQNMLNQIAGVLYEMHRMDGDLGGRWTAVVGDLLYSVVNLVEVLAG
ncbi:hypothetical protein GQ53DRAFT_752996 [Thozetella sp. PMI_491]|nr:hypothetical protein GQ53DRAFT_752996 [Thozetella sp. PMI_491]